MFLSFFYMELILFFLRGFRGSELISIENQIQYYLTVTQGNGISDKIKEDNYIINIDNCKPYIEYGELVINYRESTISYLDVTTTYVFDFEFTHILRKKKYSVSRKRMTAVVKYDKLEFYVRLTQKLDSQIFKTKNIFYFDIFSTLNYNLYKKIIKSDINEEITNKLSGLFETFLRRIKLNFASENEINFNRLIQKVEEAGLLNVSEYLLRYKMAKFCCFDYFSDTTAFYNFSFVLYYETSEYSQEIKVMISPVKFTRNSLSFGEIFIIEGEAEKASIKELVTRVFEKYLHFLYN